MSIETPVYVQLGPRRWELGGEYLKLLEPCNYCLDATNVGDALRKELNDKGYIYLQNVLPEREVLNAKFTGILLHRMIEKVTRSLILFLNFSYSS
jgi:hypothetical protein